MGERKGSLVEKGGGKNGAEKAEDVGCESV